jgi:cytochrome c-type biogenesis protein CcmH/NrfG
MHLAAVKADPFATAAYQKLAECEHQAGRHQEVVARMRMAIRDNPEWTRGWYYLGRAQKALGQAARAKPALAKACAAGVSEACQ